jgi:predicted CXXCH cytochrome family protein
VTVTKDGVTQSGYSKVILRWQTGTNFKVQRVTGYDSIGTPLWSGNLSFTVGTDGYSEYVHNPVLDYTNQVYRVGVGNGSNTWLEARVFPPNESAHSNYSKNTDTCKGCHRTHYAVHEKLLSYSIIYELCISCHDGLGSKYNVLDGLVRTGSGAAHTTDSPAGAFRGGATSFHNVFLEQGGTELMAPGNTGGTFTNPNGAKMTLTCTDCHSAHVVRNVTSHFRLLKTEGSNTLVDAYAVYNSSTGEYKTNYRRYMNDFCSGCHAYYNYNEHALGHSIQPFNRPDYNNETTYRHPTGIDIGPWLDARASTTKLPLEQHSSARNLSCITCHFAHGTTVRGWQISPEKFVDKVDEDGSLVYLTRLQLEASTKKSWDTLYAEGFREENGIITEVPSTYHPHRTTGLTTSTMLKREDNMGVCFDCHKLQ